MDCFVALLVAMTAVVDRRKTMALNQSSDLTLYGVSLSSRLMLGTSQYPSPAILANAARASRAEILTVSLRRESARLKEGQDFWRLIRDIGARVLPNTAGCRTAQEAIRTAQLAREALHGFGRITAIAHAPPGVRVDHDVEIRPGRRADLPHGFDIL